jgi:hypothetical protein
VLVIDGGGSLRCALVGDQLAALGVKNGWAGIVVYGCIRDSRAIGEMDIGVLALDTHPLKSIKKNVGEADIAVSFRRRDLHARPLPVRRRGRHAGVADRTQALANRLAVPWGLTFSSGLAPAKRALACRNFFVATQQTFHFTK